MLFHFTRVDSAVRIVLGQEFRFTFSNSIDDPFERKRNRSFSGSGAGSDLGQVFDELNKFFSELIDSTNIACFFDNVDSSGRPVDPLTDLKMWSHYGNWHKGCCIVFDKEEIIDRFCKATQGKTRKHGRVTYTDDVRVPVSANLAADLDVAQYGRTIYEAHFEKMFFQKSLCYAGENEYRLVCGDGRKRLELDIEGVVTSVVLGENCRDEDRRLIIQLCSLKAIPVFEMVMTFEGLLRAEA